MTTVAWACQNCWYWDRDTKQSEEESTGVGHCRIHPPAVSATSRALFPVTASDDWCGQFASSAEAEHEANEEEYRRFLTRNGFQHD